MIKGNSSIAEKNCSLEKMEEEKINNINIKRHFFLEQTEGFKIGKNVY